VKRAGPIQAIAERILPQSRVELLPYLALAITAGLCEEFLYRGFAMAVLVHVGLQAWVAVLLSSILFGLAHSYQGRGWHSDDPADRPHSGDKPHRLR